MELGDVLTCVHTVCSYRYLAGIAPFLNISWSLFVHQARENVLDLSPFKSVTRPS
jgi:hypothetical protein